MSFPRIRMNTGAPRKGFATAYLIAAIALMGLVAWAGSQMWDANAEIRWVGATSDIVQEQAYLIRKQVISCGTAYPGGDNGDAASTSAYRKYPASSPDLGLITCPGAPVAEQKVFGGRDGIFLRKLPPDFSAWSYANTAAGITATMTTNTARGAQVAAKLAARFGAAEASVSGNTFTFVIAAP